MQYSVWFNLSSSDLKKSRKFYENIGFEINRERSGPQMLGLFAGSNRVVINLFPEKTFKGYIGDSSVNTSDEVLISLGANSETEVNELATKVTKAGGVIYAQPEHTDDWMYGFAFSDPDGHKWNILYMDMNKMPNGV